MIMRMPVVLEVMIPVNIVMFSVTVIMNLMNCCVLTIPVINITFPVTAIMKMVTIIGNAVGVFMVLVITITFRLLWS